MRDPLKHKRGTKHTPYIYHAVSRESGTYTPMTSPRLITHLQGFYHAARAIYREEREGKEAALIVFVQWASPAAWFEVSTIDGQSVLLEKV